MLKGMRKAAGGFFAKVLLIVLILSFAVWGIGDIFRGGNPDTLAIAGDDTITLTEFENNLRRLQRNFGENYSEELFAQLNIPGQLLETMVNKSVLHQEARSLGLRIDDNAIASMLAQNEEFSGTDGAFDSNLLNMFLRNAQLSEAQFMHQAREDMASELLRNTFFASPVVPDALVDLIYAGQHEKRSFNIALFGEKSAKTATLDEETLKTFYEENMALFMEPEKRRIAVMMLSPATLQSQISVADEDVQNYYIENKDTYMLSEQREVKQLLFDAESDAQTAFNALESGTSFDNVANTSAITNKGNTALGFVNREAIFDEAANLVFAMNTGDHTVPLQSTFGWHIFSVKSIQGPQTRPLTDVEKNIRTQLEQEAFEERIYTLSGDIDDAIAGGASLESVAEQFGATMTTTDLIAASEAEEEETLSTIIKESFALAEGIVSPLRVTQDGTYYVSQVLEVQEAAATEFDANNKDLRARAKEALERNAVRDAANSFYAKTHNNSFSDAAKEDGVRIKTSKALGRTDAKLAINGAPNIDTNTALITALFQLSRDAVSAPFPLSDGRYLVAQVNDIIEAPAADSSIETRAKLEHVRNQMQDMLNVELNTQYLMYLRQKYGISVNQDALQFIFGTPDA